MANNKKAPKHSRKQASSPNKRQAPTIAIAALAVLLVAGIVLFGPGSGNKDTVPGAADSLAASAPATDSLDLVIPVNEVSETASFYPIDLDGTRLEVVAVKAPDGSIRTAFNTCQICYDSGRGYYKQQGNVLVCQNCGNQFPMSRVEVEAGGCNPWPIFDEDKTVTDASITISHDFLTESKGIFANWGGSY